MDIMKMGADLLMRKLGGEGGLDLDNAGNLLSGLFSDGDGNFNMQSMLDSLQEQGLGGLADSWLGDGDNEAISPEQIQEVVGADKIRELASQFGSDEGSLLSGLSEALPQVVDKSSSGGSLLDSIGGLDGVMDMAKKFF